MGTFHLSADSRIGLISAVAVKGLRQLSPSLTEHTACHRPTQRDVRLFWH